MKKIILLLLALAIVTAISVVCVIQFVASAANDTPSSPQLTKEIDLAGVRILDVSHLDVVLTADSCAPTATLRYNEKVAQKLSVRREGSTLIVGIVSKMPGRLPRPQLTLASDSILAIDATVGSLVKVKGTMRSDTEIHLDATTGSKLELDSALCKTKLIIDTSTGASVSIAYASSQQISADATTGSKIDIHEISTGAFIADATTGAGINVLSGIAEHVSADASTGSGIYTGTVEKARFTNSASTGAFVN